jgi:hypothetical protein
MGFNITELQGSNVAAIIAALQALCPDLVTTSQKGLLAPDAEAIQAGFIKLATSSNKGLMSKAFAAILENPEKIVFTPGLSLTQNAGYHNSIYRGKYLGTSVSAAQYAAISAGTFDDLFIGDYWTINGVNWRIAAFDYWYNCGDTACNTHHVVIVPDSNLTSSGLNSTNITTGGYVGTDFYTAANSNTAKATVTTAINSAFGSGHILSKRELFSNATADGKASGWSWYDSTIDLMNESMVYGSPVSGAQKTGDTNFNVGIDKSQLPLFRHDPSRICNRAYWWLRDVVSATYFARVTAYGNATYNNASDGNGIRPAFGIRA